VTKRRRYTDDEKATVRNMWEAGEPVIAIAAAIKTSPERISSIRTFLGLPPRPRGGYRGKVPGLYAPGKDHYAIGVAPDRDEVVLYLRRLGVVVFGAGPGRWNVNYRRVVDRAGLVATANKWREWRDLPPFDVPDQSEDSNERLPADR